MREQAGPRRHERPSDARRITGLPVLEKEIPKFLAAGTRRMPVGSIPPRLSTGHINPQRGARMKIAGIVSAGGAVKWQD